MSAPSPAPFSRAALALDPAAEAARIEAAIRDQVTTGLRRRGTVVGLSGGVDSSVVAALCARALGRERTLGLFLPEAESSPEGLELGRRVAADLGIACELWDVTAMLEAAGCYRRRDEAVRALIPEFGPGWKCKVVLGGTMRGTGIAYYRIVARDPDGNERRARLTADAHLALVAAMNFKQRTRKMVEYYFADRLLYAVASTPNRLEYEQGFFVKLGDGAGDLKPIAHLYKSQVYQLAEYLGIAEEIRRRPPTTDTYPLEQSQEEFYFGLSYEAMDLCLLGRNRGIPPAEVAAASALTAEQVEQAYRSIDEKRRTARYLHARPLLVEEIPSPEP